MKVLRILSAFLLILSVLSCFSKTSAKNKPSVWTTGEQTPIGERVETNLVLTPILSTDEDTQDVIVWNQTEIADAKETLNLEDLFGEYTVIKFAPRFSIQNIYEDMKETIARVYKRGYDRISISKERITFGDDIVDDPIFHFLEKEVRVFPDSVYDYEERYEYIVDPSQENSSGKPPEYVPSIQVKKMKLKINGAVESGVEIPGFKYYNCSETSLAFPDLKRKYGVVIYAGVPTLVWGIEPIDGNHIVIDLPYAGLLVYRKEGSF
jgi:hypothetical protein